MPGRSTLMNIGSRLGLSLIDLRFHRVHDSHTKRYIVTNLAQCPSFLGEPRAQLFCEHTKSIPRTFSPFSGSEWLKARSCRSRAILVCWSELNLTDGPSITMPCSVGQLRR